MSEVRALSRLPFSFAKRHGVLLLASREAGPAAVMFKAGVAPSAIMEVRRFVGAPIVLEGLGDRGALGGSWWASNPPGALSVS